jgi:hypothetical protein
VRAAGQIDNREIIRRLAEIGPNPTAAFRRLCAAAQVCPRCCRDWDSCPCVTPLPAEPEPAEVTA